MILCLICRVALSITLTVPPISRAHPDLGVVAGPLGEARALVDQHVVGDLVRVGVDEVGHVGGLGGVDHPLAVVADPHALRLDADRDLGQHLAAGDVDHRDHVVVLVGDVDQRAVRREVHQLGVGPRRQRADDLVRGGVHDLDRVVVGGADVELLAVGAQDDAARPVADRDGRRHLELVAVDDRDRVALLVGDEDLARLAAPVERPAAPSRARIRRAVHRRFSVS